jgi:hypothetical protein
MILDQNIEILKNIIKQLGMFHYRTYCYCYAQSARRYLENLDMAGAKTFKASFNRQICITETDQNQDIESDIMLYKTA